MIESAVEGVWQPWGLGSLSAAASLPSSGTEVRALGLGSLSAAASLRALGALLLLFICNT